MKRKVNYKCKDCGSESIYWDASAVWDPETQQYEMSDCIGNDAFCGDCGSENNAKTVDFVTGEELQQGPLSFEWLPLAEAAAAWKLFHDEQRKKADERRVQVRALEIANLLAADREFA